MGFLQGRVLTRSLDSSWPLESNARIEDGALILGGDGFALSDPVAKPIAARTLESLGSTQWSETKRKRRCYDSRSVRKCV